MISTSITAELLHSRVKGISARRNKENNCPYIEKYHSFSA